ncbi:PadR family transcriptional regulator [Antribacter gilvus]|uniref:PadR family transcriptional regulator n=1 Tax=Antribacter gilvus TaxID=2304675 RepID=UPI003B837547
MEHEAAWPADWLRGVLEVCVLRALADGPTYGYAVATRLSEAGLGTIKGGTLYPLLRRFEDAGWVAVQWQPGAGGPGRKYYELTSEGRAALEQRRREWSAFAGITTAFILGESEAGPADEPVGPNDQEASR